jgi:segregation and condensation protein A
MGIEAMTYNIKLEAFEGPLDLLLHLIKKNEVNIYDIPIALITDQYLEYLRLMKALNLDLAGEFLVLAATLLQIKSKTLLPSPEEGEEIDGEEEQDNPRDELVRRLLEYQRYKEAARKLNEREILGRDVFSRGLFYEESSAFEEGSFREATLFDLIEAFRRVTRKTPPDQFIEIKRGRIHLEAKMREIIERLKKKGSLVFQSLFQDTSQKEEIIVAFLAILELIRLKAIKVYQATAYGTIKIYPASGGQVLIFDNSGY